MSFTSSCNSLEAKKSELVPQLAFLHWTFFEFESIFFGLCLKFWSDMIRYAVEVWTVMAVNSCNSVNDLVLILLKCKAGYSGNLDVIHSKLLSSSFLFVEY
jgi:hypothetical protein